MPNMPKVVLPHPLGGIPLDKVYDKLDVAFDEIVAQLTLPPAKLDAVSPVGAFGGRVEISAVDEWGDLQRELLERGWGDGLPLVPPTEARVQAMVDFCGLPADHVVGVVEPGNGVATVENIASNAVMAGCSPQHMPLLVAAVKALSDPRVFLRNIQATTHPISPMLIVSGPLTQALNINCGSGVFGPGPWANGVLGRALRLVMLNIGGGKPIAIDKATMGHPGKYSYCMAENEAANPWPSLRAERGFGADTSTVTVFGCESPHNINDHESTTAGGLLTTICGAMAQTGQNNVYYPCELLLILSPEHAATIVGDGYSKDDVRQSIYEGARIPMTRFSRENIERRLWRYLAKRYRNRPIDTPVGVVQRAEDVLILVAGGPGKHSMYAPTSGSSHSVTCPIVKADGSPWLPSDFQA